MKVQVGVSDKVADELFLFKGGTSWCYPKVTPLLHPRVALAGGPAALRVLAMENVT